MVEFALGYIFATMIYAIVEVVCNKGKIDKEKYMEENNENNK